MRIRENGELQQKCCTIERKKSENKRNRKKLEAALTVSKSNTKQQYIEKIKGYMRKDGKMLHH